MSEIIVPYGPIYNRYCEDALQMIPEFDRLPFNCVFGEQAELAKENKKFDIILKKPTPWDNHAIPVGIVSKQYALIQHRDLFRMVFKALEKMNISFNNLVHQFEYSPNWESFFFSVRFPEKYTLNPGDGNPMDLQLVCFNSVNGRKLLRIELGWFRLVCQNGMVVGEKKFSIRKRHVGNFNISNIQYIIQQGLKQIQEDKDQFQDWFKTLLKKEASTNWINNDLKNKWGVKAAVRAYHICHRGIDVKMEPFSQGKPTEKSVRDLTKVPGSAVPAQNLYAVSQSLAWIASQKKDFDERLAWQRMIPGLIESLKKMN